MCPWANCESGGGKALVVYSSCEADPVALAKYVVALIKKDKPRNELKDSCFEQLDVFLQSSKNI